MPTLYTALRARHRHKVIPADHPIPVEIARASALRTLGVEGRGLQLQTPRRVVVIGGGLAGLCAAYELKSRFGFQHVSVFEARPHVGGRVQSVTDVVAWKVLEGGGELIGSNHPLWMAYKDAFGLMLDDVRDYGTTPIRLSGHTLTFEQSEALTTEMERELDALTMLAAMIVDPFEPWTTPNAERLDATSLGEWITQARCPQRCKDAIATQLASDNGIPASEQSLLGVLAMIRGGGLDRYWTDTELFRCSGGNARLADAFRDALNTHGPCVFEGSPVIRIVRSPEGVSCFVEGKEEPHIADDVILAIPPSVWHTIQIDGDDTLAQMLREPPAMGRNVKYLMGLRQRFWRPFGGAPTVSADGPVDLTWETTEAAARPSFGLVGFSGASDADTCRAWGEDERRSRYLDALCPVLPGLDQNLEHTKFMDWPAEPWTAGSYYFPRVNEVMRWGPLWKSGHGGWLHFAGEHTCFAFVGYMEGALASGFRLARRLAVREGICVG